MQGILSPSKLRHLLIIFSFLAITGKAPAIVVEFQTDSLEINDSLISAEEMVRGERLFYGLAYPAPKSVNCARCHNTSVSDTLNWNPDAVTISLKYRDKSIAAFTKVLLNPVGKKMSEVHKGFELTAADIILLKAYMDELAGRGLKKAKPVITNLLILIISFILFSISATDLIVKKLFKDQRINGAILTITSVVIIWILAVSAIALGRSRGFSPEQPIKFSHAVHAGQNKTDCLYCHSYAHISKSAGIPSGNVCMNCHLLVRNGTRSGAAEISKVVSNFENGKAVEWVRIYHLPDFVFFSHAQHVNAGQQLCETCHGDVKKMDRLYQVPDLSMGWCIDCHDTRKVNFSNEYYKTYYSKQSESIRNGSIDSVVVTGIGGKNCGKCHY